MEQDRCPDCGAPVGGGREGCQRLWDELSHGAGVMAGPAFDAYCLQHLPRYCASAKSYAAHLTRLCCGLEYGGEPGLHRALQRWLNGSVDLHKPAPPAHLGHMTIADVHAGETPADQAALALRWVSSVWQAYESQHELARAWIRQASGRR